MENLFFFVDLVDEYGFHLNFFVDHGAFTFGFLVALAAGVVVALAFYFGCCNNRNSSSMATVSMWIISLVLSGAIAFSVADFAIVGVGEESSFVAENEVYYNEQYADSDLDNDQLQLVRDEMDEIAESLSSGENQAALPFAAGCAVYALLFFYITSVVIKGHTISGVSIPHKWPN